MGGLIGSLALQSSDRRLSVKVSVFGWPALLGLLEGLATCQLAAHRGQKPSSPQRISGLDKTRWHHRPVCRPVLGLRGLAGTLVPLRAVRLEHDVGCVSQFVDIV